MVGIKIQVTKILLSSAGLTSDCLSTALLNLIPKKPSEVRALIVSDIQDEDDAFFVNAVERELESIGIDDYRVFNLNCDECDLNIRDTNLFYICGGNTFHILHRLRVTGLDKLIKELVQSEQAVYLGISAGSIIAGPSIAIAGWGSEGDKNEINLKDLSGFGFVDFTVFPHYRPELKDEVEGFRKLIPYDIFEIEDTEGVVVSDGKRELIR